MKVKVLCELNIMNHFCHFVASYHRSFNVTRKQVFLRLCLILWNRTVTKYLLEPCNCFSITMFTMPTKGCWLYLKSSCTVFYSWFSFIYSSKIVLYKMIQIYYIIWIHPISNQLYTHLLNFKVFLSLVFFLFNTISPTIFATFICYCKVWAL